MADDTPGGAYRRWRADCPNCGAPVEFASAASASAVCGFCRSTLLREGDALRRIGISAELFDDHSPLQLGASGTLQGMPFTLVGRLQLAYPEGQWNEWHALFDNGRSAWLAEDNGAYVIGFDAELPAEAPADAAALDALQVGQRLKLGGQDWTVASSVQARLAAAEGELPAPPRLAGAYRVVELRNVLGEVGSLDASEPQRLHWSIGRAVALTELAMRGLRESAERVLGAAGLACPNCGAALAPKLEASQSIACGQCAAVVDLAATGAAGAELPHFVQRGAHREPQIALGKRGTLALGAAPVTWQVVGYLERRDLPEPGSDDESSAWREYLLHEPGKGFAFLVDADEGWSWVKPITGTPVLRGEAAEWAGASYRKTWDYDAEVTWIQGEFYWRIARGERARVTDYEGTGKFYERRLSRERTGGERGGAEEITWSAGATLDAAVVAKAFGLAAPRLVLRDASPASGQRALVRLLLIMAVLFVLTMILGRCAGDRCDDLRSSFGEASHEYRQCLADRSRGGVRPGGGSFGGWSSGGGHK